MSEHWRKLLLNPVRGRALRDRLLDRARLSREESGKFVNIRYEDGVWRTIVPGARAKKLVFAGSQSALVELDAGATIPMHRHHRQEECVVLRGCVQMGDLQVGPGEYHLAPAGSLHAAVRSPGGALLYLRGAPLRGLTDMLHSLIAAWLPDSDSATLTIRAHEGAWESAVLGVQTKRLWCDDGQDSLFLRLAPNAATPAVARDSDEEIMVVEGEAFFGDSLLRACELQFASAGDPPRAISSDRGALLYVHRSAPTNSATTPTADATVDTG